MGARASISVLAIVIASSACWTGPVEPAPPVGGPAVTRVEPAPPTCTGAACLPAIDYLDTTGARTSRRALAGHVVVVNFWATWAHPCRIEIPHLANVAAAYRARGVVVLGILIADPGASDVRAFAARSGLTFTYPIVRASPEILSAYDYPQALPATFIFDRAGRLVARHVGALGEAELRAIIDPLLGRP